MCDKQRSEGLCLPIYRIGARNSMCKRGNLCEVGWRGMLPVVEESLTLTISPGPGPEQHRRIMSPWEAPLSSSCEASKMTQVIVGRGGLQCDAVMMMIQMK